MPYGRLHHGREAVAQKVLGLLAQDIPASPPRRGS
jgi:hypothetical protein